MSGIPKSSPDGSAWRLPIPALGLRRALMLVLVAGTAAAGLRLMLDILRTNGMRPLEAAVLVLFAITFTWLAVAFWTAVIGFLLELLGRHALTLRRRGEPPGPPPELARTALVMPICNEDVPTVLAGLEATWRSLAATGHGAWFDCYLLSDSTDPQRQREEAAGLATLRRRLGEPPGLYYRHREDNRGRKPGNLAEFCQRWGALYEYMVVLDADSVMAGETLVTLVRRMQANPDTGLIQTVPLPVGQQTGFARLLQLAASLYSPMLAHGLAFWQGDTANYWGHNAILRIRPFTEHCGLAPLPGRPPLGGEILSHDFVEAALLRRAGWRVLLLPELGGSFEGLPGNLLDYLRRDRRWCQGNLQHLRLLAVRGLHPISRLHFALGALAFIASLLWLLMLAASTADAVINAVSTAQFFGTGYQLFPDWPVSRPDLIRSLLAVTIGLLAVPKVLGLLLALLRRRQAYGGGVRLTLAAAGEAAFAVIIAPLTMAFHAAFVVTIAAGRAVSWDPQDRDARALPWGEVWRRVGPVTVLALAWGALAAVLAPAFLPWLAPVLFGPLVAAPLVRWSSTPWPGPTLLATAEERQAPVLAEYRRCLRRHAHRPLPAPALPPLPPERGRPMPVRPLAAPLV
ncbi:glucans biosynthesis glucosyltransferase MdoH [Sediminicurvatus halobius]|uniref:Glucans biosynthesis glucosyltransferase H n=1 Tax=Sediminicurvatus halobius TaxID=2182432 RepID=A0A2U2N3A1_9GAMM|nr:glucans biosynthesis glucosyltransferase MdoH [Spiribacter halobius]PWG63701.1 glucans biosynthesis glucosyltransferase MdoH [Spiribacter halobius]UEX79839.1 glucans biosynthesis glucosyltransferase MdoH [Spiribacter halobius]